MQQLFVPENSEEKIEDLLKEEPLPINGHVQTSESLIQMYGNKEVFAEKLVKGYTGIRFGQGKWKDDYRIVFMWVFDHPDGSISTYQLPKVMTESGHSMRPNPISQDFDTENQLVAYTFMNRVQISKPSISLKNLYEESQW